MSNPFQHTFERVTYGELLVVPIICFFAPIKGILLTVLAVIVLDTLTGIWKSGLSKFSSRGFSAFLSKILIYESLLLVSYMVSQYILGDILMNWFSVEHLLTKAVALACLFTELKSIDENFKEKRGIGLLSAIRQLVTRSKEFKEEVKK